MDLSFRDYPPRSFRLWLERGIVLFQEAVTISLGHYQANASEFEERGRNE